MHKGLPRKFALEPYVEWENKPFSTASTIHTFEFALAVEGISSVVLRRRGWPKNLTVEVHQIAWSSSA